ncbi:hypothetical protein POTOM_060473 [Populus tomentosa]|uniref:Uncharacterized protein n=1 Tax=Populus tomentosa TaxID=118781 RepID=A0A8X7XRX7_POPTO|nr:hypothetical protein POTOM_060473 [Populus tomentosa]
MAAIGSFSLLRNCAVTTRAFSNVRVSPRAPLVSIQLSSFILTILKDLCFALMLYTRRGFCKSSCSQCRQWSSNHVSSLVT